MSPPDSSGPPEATALVIAGGRSIRFGRNKLTELYRGTPILQRAVLRVAEVCGDVVLVLAPDAPRPALPDGVHVRVARDEREGEGPLAGVDAGLRVIESGSVLLVAGDMPDLRPPVLRELLRVAAEEAAAAVGLWDVDRIRPVPSVVDAKRARDAAGELLQSGHRRLRDLLEALDVTGVAEAVWRTLDPEGATLFDVDVPGDLAT